MTHKDKLLRIARLKAKARKRATAKAAPEGSATDRADSYLSTLPDQYTDKDW